MQVVRFEVGGRQFALDVMAVKEVVLPRPVQEVPGQPDFVDGLVEMRGEYVPLVDLRARFGCGSSDENPRIIVLSCRRREIALLVDAVGEVQWIGEEDLRGAPLDTSALGAGAVKSIAEIDGAMVLLLAGEAILTDAEWSLLAPL